MRRTQFQFLGLPLARAASQLAPQASRPRMRAHLISYAADELEALYDRMCAKAAEEPPTEAPKKRGLFKKSKPEGR